MPNLQINLDWLHEYLTSISNYFGEFEGFDVIQELIFHSTRRTYGPYGSNWGQDSYFKYFSLPLIVGKIIDFTGPCDPFSHINKSIYKVVLYAYSALLNSFFFFKV